MGRRKGSALAPYGCWVPLSINLWSTRKYLRSHARVLSLPTPLSHVPQSGYLDGEHPRIHSRTRGRRTS